jgi:hypothetical protein
MLGRLAALLMACLAVENREEAWQADLKFLETQFGGHQKDFSKLYPHFHEEMSELRSEIGMLTDPEITLRLMKMVASAHVGHNSVYLPVLKFHPVPLSLNWYSDGLAVVSAAPDFAQALGTRVVRIGSMTP